MTTRHAAGFLLPWIVGMLIAFGAQDQYPFRDPNLPIEQRVSKKNGEVTVSLNVKNTGSRPGEEVVQLYVAHLKSKVARPIKELKGFRRFSLKPGETKTVQVPLKAEALAFWDEDQNRWVVEEEPVRIMLGRSSGDIKLTRTLDLVP